MAEKKRISQKKERIPTEIEIEEEKKKKREEQKKEHNKILKAIFFIVGVLAVAFVVYLIATSSASSFTYQGINFKVMKFCDSKPCLVKYQTSIPVIYQGKTIPYNFYMTNDPRKLNVSFNGSVVIKKDMIFDTESDFVCNGEGGIAGANFVQLYAVLGVNITLAKNATCDTSGKKMLIDIKPGNVTSIEQTGPACYNINIKDCEILQGTEKFMIETLKEVNQLLDNQSNQTR